MDHGVDALVTGLTAVTAGDMVGFGLRSPLM